MKPITAFLLCIALFLPLTLTHAADLEREQRLHDEIIDTILDGEGIMLPDGEREFLAIDMESGQDTTKGGVLILHGRGFHPNWDNVARPLRVGLANAGWRTLSLQMPVLEKNAKYYDYVPLFEESLPRIEAGIDYLKQQGIDKIVLIAHSCGAHMAMHWIRERGDADFLAYVGIGMGATDYKQEMAQPFPLASMTIPVFDIYGENDYPAVQRMATERCDMIQQIGNKKSRQKKISGADHYFNDANDALVVEVRDWLDSLL